MKYDLLTFREEWISGSFSIFKNTIYVNNLFKRSKTYKKYFLSRKHVGYDECLGLYDKLRGKESTHIFLCDNEESFTWVVRKEEVENKIKVYSKQLIKECIPKNDYVHYHDGKVEQKDGKSFLYYHYITEKNNNMFSFPNWKTIPDEFYIDYTGFFTVNEFVSWKRFPITLWRQVISLLSRPDLLSKRVYIKFSNMVGFERSFK